MDTTNECRNFEPQLDAFHDGELAGAEKLAVEKHLQGCTACVGKLAEIDRVVHTLKTMPRPQVSSTLAAKLDSIAESGGGNKVVPIRPRVWVPVAAAAAAIAIFAGLKMTQSDIAPITASKPQASQQTIQQQAPLQKQVEQQPELAAQPQQTAAPEHVAPEHAAAQQKAPVIAEQPSAPSAVHKTAAKANENKSSDNTRMIAKANNAKSEDEVAELPTTSQGFNEALGFATDEDGLYDIKM